MSQHAHRRVRPPATASNPPPAASTTGRRTRDRRTAASLGIYGVRPYDLRHSYGTVLYRVAGDTRLVKDVLGHSDTRMTKRYTLGHVPETMRIATSRLEKHLGASTSET